MSARPKETKVEITGAGVSDWIPLRHDDLVTNVSLFLSAPAGVTGDVTVEMSSTNAHNTGPATFLIHKDPLGNPISLVANSTVFLAIISPVFAVRFRGVGITGGNAEIRVVQAGPVC